MATNHLGKEPDSRQRSVEDPTTFWEPHLNAADHLGKELMTATNHVGKEPDGRETSVEDTLANTLRYNI